MKKYLLSVTIALVGQVAFGQVTGIPNADQVKSKFEKSTKDIENPKRADNPKTWINRGEVYLDAIDVHNYELRTNMSIQEVKLLYGSPTSVNQEEINNEPFEEDVYPYFSLYVSGGKVAFWKETNQFVDSAYHNAYKSFDKAYTLDSDKKQTKKIAEGLNALALKYNVLAMNFYTQRDYAQAFHAFEGSQLCTSNPAVDKVDSAIIYYAGVTAQLAGKCSEGIKYLEKAREINYTNSGELYYYLYSCNMADGDTAKAGEEIEKGFSLFPTNKTLMLSLINYYIVKNESPAKVINYLDKAILADPTNASLYNAKATLYEKLPDLDKAAEAYKKAIEISPEYFDAYFNLGVMYYNQGAAKVELANKLPMEDTKGYDSLKVEADNYFKKALPYIEKSYQLQPNESVVIETLKNLYFRFRTDSDEMMAKFKEFQEKSKALKGN